MSYKVLYTDEEDGTIIYSDGKRSCIGIDKPFQEWLKDNKDSLPSDIQKKIDDGELIIAD
tara:strand:+ start:349 stop:528 length:180 start_codon:yes stop_codon:yes gene_type:complete